jgi:cellobiose phosphorylase
MTRRFRGATYRIRVTTGAPRREMRVDGRLTPGEIVPAFGHGVHVVEVLVPHPREEAGAGS